MMAGGGLLQVAIPDLTIHDELHSTVICNDTCCQYSNDEVICFGDYNFTDKNSFIHVPVWEMTIRWSFTSLVFLMAVLGNLAIIIILSKNRLLLRTSVNLFILNMSVADLITALAGPIPFTIRDTQTFWPLGETWCHLEGYIQMMVMLVSVTSLATISCDRMMGVVRPFHRHLKKWQSLAIIALIWVSSALLSIPWGIYRVYTVHIWQDVTETICGESDNMDIWWIVGIIGLTWLPLLIMLVSYTTIFVYFNHRRFRSAVKNEHPVLTHLKKRVVQMMFVVVVSFIVCWTPFQIFKLSYKSFLDDSGHFRDDATEELYNTMLTVGQYMIYVNPAVNPIIYALMHQTFRRAFRVTFPCVFKRKSSLVLIKGQGMTRYMWSVKSTTSIHTDNLNPRTRARTNSSRQNSSFSEISTIMCENPRQSLANSQDCSTNPPVNEKKIRKKIKCPCSRSHKTKKTTETEEADDTRTITRTGHLTVTLELTQHDLTQPGFTNEGFVKDLTPRPFSIVSTGALGDLITHVIVEESSSEVEKERIL